MRGVHLVVVGYRIDSAHVAFCVNEAVTFSCCLCVCVDGGVGGSDDDDREKGHIPFFSLALTMLLLHFLILLAPYLVRL